MPSADVGMTRLQFFVSLLPLLLMLGCTQLIAVTGDPGDPLPAKTPGQPDEEASQESKGHEFAGGEIEGSDYPRVMLSKFHAQWCSREVGDQFPELELAQLGGSKTKLDALAGQKATVVLFWHKDRWMSRMAVEDIQREVVVKFAAAEIAVVGIPVRMTAQKVRRVLKQSSAEFPQLLDVKGEALESVGSVALPRLYVLDPSGTIVWFDIEYSESSRRELLRTLAVLAEQQ